MLKEKKNFISEEEELAWIDEYIAAAKEIDEKYFKDRPADTTPDIESYHREMDNLFINVLLDDGLEEVVNMFLQRPKWYA